MTRNPADLLLNEHLDYLKLTCVKENCQPLAVESAANHWSHLDYLGRLLQGEVAARQQRTIARRIKAARFPVIKTLEGFRWDWPKKINRLQIQDLFRLSFIEQKANVIFLGLVGLGKTHLATALGYAACQHGYSVLFANAIDVINTLSAAQTKGALKSELKRISHQRYCSSTRLAIFPSTSAEPTCSSRSSANATNAVLSYLPPTKPSNNGLPSSTAIALSPPPCSIVSSTTPKPF
jgi:hypothetical protein